MKNILIKIKMGTVVCLVAFLCSCDFLDIVPDNVPTIDYAFSDRANAERFLYSCYSYRPANGDVYMDPALAGSDEVWERNPYTSYGVTWTPCRIARGEQTVNSAILNFWDGVYRGGNQSVYLFRGIRDCNIFLENIDGVVIDMVEDERTRWISEAKFLKAWYHFYLLRTYGPIPIIDKNLPISAGVDEVKVWREPIDDVVAYIVGTLEDAIPGLPDARQLITSTEGGRANKLIAYSLIAEVRLWAASPLVNGNSTYSAMVDGRGKHLFPEGAADVNKWTLAVKACEDAINICHAQEKSLYRVVDPLTYNAPEFFQQQTVYRQAICDRWNSELIWGGTKFDILLLDASSQPRLVRRLDAAFTDRGAEMAPTMKMVERYYSSNGVPIDEDKEWRIENTWYEDRFKIRPETPSGDEIYRVKENERTVYLHYNREPRFYASIGFDKGIYYGSGYYKFPDDVKYCQFFNGQVSGYTAAGFHSTTGYAAKKMHSFKNAQTTNNTSSEYFPFPICRLADLYLMYAEAVNEAEGPNGPNSAKMFEYLDAIRDRAGLAGVKESWAQHSINPDKPDSQDGLREIIRRERTIELMFEGKRFWDIRRWKLIDELNEQPRGWDIMGADEEDFYNVVNTCEVNVKFSVKNYFFPIYENNLYVNDHLIQNYGW